MKVAITGGAGFIGSNLASKLLSAGHEVSIFDNLETGNLENLRGLKIDLVEGDLRNFEEIRKFLTKNRFDYCFHLGAMGSVPRSIENPRISYETNVLGTFNLLEASRLELIPITYTSSSSVYGSNLKLPKSEMDWTAPISPYGSFKAANESMMIAYAKVYGIKINIFRLFNVYGPRQNPFGAYSAVVPRWTLSALKNKPITVYGDGNQKRDLTYVEDVNRVLLRTMESHTFESYPVNLAFGKPKSLNSVIEIFKEYFPSLEVIYAPSRKGDIRDSESDPKKLKQVIGDFEPTNLRDGLFSTFNWYNENLNV